jgi:hypothetical protein
MLEQARISAPGSKPLPRYPACSVTAATPMIMPASSGNERSNGSDGFLARIAAGVAPKCKHQALLTSLVETGGFALFDPVQPPVTEIHVVRAGAPFPARVSPAE